MGDQDGEPCPDSLLDDAVQRDHLAAFDGPGGPSSDAGADSQRGLKRCADLPSVLARVADALADFAGIMIPRSR
jgi:hypothetical protein